jgi:hypothetical protein
MMSDDAVKAKTGKTWPEWFAILDKAKATTMTHRDIVALLGAKHDVGSWWRQMITVAYERARGMREKHQTSKGFQMSSTKTIAAPSAALFDAWTDDARRRAWLGPAKLTIRKTNAKKNVRITWKDGSTVVAHFIPKGADKTQVTVDHEGLSGAAAVAEMKQFWTARLARLKQSTES